MSFSGSMRNHPGPRAYRNQMTIEDYEQYNLNRLWISNQEAAGTLKRGWRSVVAGEAGMSPASVSNVLSGKFISPPVLNRLVEAAKNYLGHTDPIDIFDAVSQQQVLVDGVDAEIAALKRAKENGDRTLAARIEQAKVMHLQEMLDLDERIAKANNRRYKLATQLEDLQNQQINHEQDLVSR